ncbi:MAG TPA: hypothetical protein VH062_36235 [Polyangiaceae bacterium]|jgi:hypothetical protein|nr:hypothetical protein [Polyangiaceae bacterium]
MSVQDVLACAERFMWLNARVIDRLRFEYHFRDGRPEKALQALRAYECDDGGFGHALEPDFRGPSAQPLPVWTALELIDELGLSRDATAAGMVRGALGWLESVTLADGGIPFVLPSIAGGPHAPWLEPEEPPASSLLMTGLVVDVVRRLGVEHPWTARAAEFCWSAIERMTDPHPYEARSALAFLDHAGDPARVDRAFAHIAKVVRDKKLVTLAPVPGQESHTPLDFAPHPDMVARRLFDETMIDRQLDALSAAQQPDGGWNVDWTMWTPIVQPEWRGVQTIRKLRTLRAYRRL